MVGISKPLMTQRTGAEGGGKRDQVEGRDKVQLAGQELAKVPNLCNQVFNLSIMILQKREVVLRRARIQGS